MEDKMIVGLGIYSNQYKPNEHSVCSYVYFEAIFMRLEPLCVIQLQKFRQAL